MQLADQLQQLSHSKSHRSHMWFNSLDTEVQQTIRELANNPEVTKISMYKILTSQDLPVEERFPLKVSSFMYMLYDIKEGIL